jgi:plasmid maintenance system antidote protein VapI
MAKLSEYLSEKALTHQAFAEKIGVHQTTISRLCDENTVPSIGTALAIERETEGAVRASDWLARKPRLMRPSMTVSAGQATR